MNKVGHIWTVSKYHSDIFENVHTPWHQLIVSEVPS